MNFKISCIEKRKIRKIARRIVIQSQEHQPNIIEFYKALASAARNEFREDNNVTLRSFLEDCNSEALNEVLPFSKK